MSACDIVLLSTWTCLHQSPLPPSQSNFCLQMFWATLMPKNVTLRQKLFNRKSFPRLNSTLAERNLNHPMKRSRRIMNNSAIDLKRIQPWQKAKFDMPFLALGIFESWCYSRRGIISPSTPTFCHVAWLFLVSFDSLWWKVLHKRIPVTF